MFIEVEDELSSERDQSEEALHAFEGMKTDIFDVQVVVLLGTIPVFDASA